MWSLDMRFDTRFFAVASCMVGYLEISVIEFGVGVHDFVHYLTAVKRLKVSSTKTFFWREDFCSIGISFTWWIWKRSSIIINIMQRYLRDGSETNKTNTASVVQFKTSAMGKSEYSYLHRIWNNIVCIIEWNILAKEYCIRCSSRWFDLCHWTCWIWQSLFSHNLTFDWFIYLEFTFTNIDRWNRFFRWKSSTARFILLCATRIM